MPQPARPPAHDSMRRECFHLFLVLIILEDLYPVWAACYLFSARPFYGRCTDAKVFRRLAD